MEERDRLANVLQAELAEVHEVERRRLEQCVRRGRQHHLPAVRGTHDPGCSVHVHAHVPGRIEIRLAAVDTHARCGSDLVPAHHRLAHRPDRCLRRGERVEERVALVIDLVAVVSGQTPPAPRADAFRAPRDRPSVPSSSSSLVDPSASVNTRVTVPEGCAVAHRARLSSRRRDSRKRLLPLGRSASGYELLNDACVGWRHSTVCRR